MYYIFDDKGELLETTKKKPSASTNYIKSDEITVTDGNVLVLVNGEIVEIEAKPSRYYELSDGEWVLSAEGLDFEIAKARSTIKRLLKELGLSYALAYVHSQTLGLNTDLDTDGLKAIYVQFATMSKATTLDELTTQKIALVRSIKGKTMELDKMLTEVGG